MKTTFRSKVFKWAHHLARTTGKGFAVCLAKAWALYRLKVKMANGVIKFAYEKADGTLRHATGTLNVPGFTPKSSREFNEKAVAYYDVDANGFRSFKTENLIY